MSTLEGKVAIITGAAGGIGHATALALASEGAKVVAVDREEDRLASLYASLGDAYAWTAADVSEEASAGRYVRLAVERFGGVDILHANAGTEGHFGPLLEQEVSDFDRVLAVNVRGVFLGIRAAAPEMQKRGGGSIVITSSVAGLVGASGLAPYVTSKHAVIGLMRAAALELAPLGIRVNTVNPGPVDNRMMRSIEEQASPGHGDDVKRGYTAMVPLGRYATNEEVARMVRFLASDDASYCTGSVYTVDGGFVTG